METEESAQNLEHSPAETHHHAPKHKRKYTKKFWIISTIILGIIVAVHLILQPQIILNKSNVACGITVLESRFSGVLKPDNRSCFCIGKKNSLETNVNGRDLVDYCDGVGLSTINLNQSETE